MSEWNWGEASEGEAIPSVFIINMDIDKSQELSSVTHPIDYQSKINVFQTEVENILTDNLFYKDTWTGDGLVALYRHSAMEADDLIIKTLEVVELLREKNKAGYFERQGILPIGIAVGTIIFQKRIGGIVGHVMNKAGLLRKNCPPAGGILMTDAVYQLIKSTALKNRFKPTLFMIGPEIKSVYYLPQIGDKIPPFITSTGVTKEIDLSSLFEGEAKYSDLREYLSEVQEQAKGAQEIILTGRAPVWLYLHAALRLKGSTRRLVYRDGQGHLFEILDQTLL